MEGTKKAIDLTRKDIGSLLKGLEPGTMLTLDLPEDPSGPEKPGASPPLQGGERT